MKKTFMLTLVLMFGICAMGITTASAGGDCCPKGPGTGSPGYWKNHPDAWPPGFSITFDECPYEPLRLERDDIIEIMDGPVAGNKWITLFKAYVAASLNVEIGNCRPCCYWDGNSCGINLDSAYGWLNDNCGTRVRANSDEWQYSHGEAQYFCLDDYNNGYLPMAISRDDLE